MLQAIERYMKQAIVDKVSGVSSSALVSSLVSEQVAAGVLWAPQFLPQKQSVTAILSQTKQSQNVGTSLLLYPGVFYQRSMKTGI